MNLTPTELERLTIYTAAELARRYRSQGIRLSHPEAVALISDEVLTAARKGMTHTDLVDYGRSLLTQAGEIEINAGREGVCVDVLNTGDRAIQVRSHAHFFEVNRALKFDRAATFGMRLDRPSGTGMRFEPGEIIRANLVRIGGAGNVRGFGRLTEGSIHSGETKQRGLRLAKERGYQGA